MGSKDPYADSTDWMNKEEGRIGPVPKGKDSAASAAYSRLLFKGPVGMSVPAASSPTPAP